MSEAGAGEAILCALLAKDGTRAGIAEFRERNPVTTFGALSVRMQSAEMGKVGEQTITNAVLDIWLQRGEIVVATATDARPTKYTTEMILLQSLALMRFGAHAVLSAGERGSCSVLVAQRRDEQLVNLVLRGHNDSVDVVAARSMGRAQPVLEPHMPHPPTSSNLQCVGGGASVEAFFQKFSMNYN
eukprot:gene11169-3227_t